MTIGTILFIILLAAAVLASYKTQKLTALGALTGGAVATLIYLGSGFAGIAELAAFFILSTLATSFNKQYKTALSKQEHQQTRDAWQVLANGGIAAICGAFAFLSPTNALVFQLMLAASLASATADTLSSELGVVYGKRFYNVLNFRLDERGRDGVVSLEGTAIGIAGSALIGLVYCSWSGFSGLFYIILLAGTIGNLIDSLLGATLERDGVIGNNTVNTLNTFIAAIIAWLLFKAI